MKEKTLKEKTVREETVKEKIVKEKAKNQKGITLIALVITIIVLLILAGVSIAMLTGENGILTQATEAKKATEQGKVEEMVKVAIGALQTENLGDRSKITPQKIAEQVNDDNNRTDVTASSTTFPTNIEFAEEGLKVPVDMNLIVGESGENNDNPEGEDLPIYSEEIDESQIAPAELFDFEIIQETASNTKVATTGMISGLPQKEARITRIKPKYANKGGYNPDTDSNDLPDTNYEIRFEGITDTLIIPYQVEIDGEMYTVTEVDLSVGEKTRLGYYYATLPSIENIIYPNTVEKILFKVTGHDVALGHNNKNENIILSERLKSIPDWFFKGGEKIQKIEIPTSVTSIGDWAFCSCTSLTQINIPSSVSSIGDWAFLNCDALTTINIAKPKNSIKGAPWDAYNAKINWNYQG